MELEALNKQINKVQADSRPQMRELEFEHQNLDQKIRQLS